jgi:hypothetical protein
MSLRVFFMLNASLLLAACSDPSPPEVNAATTQTSTAAPTPASTEPVAVRMDAVFIDSDPKLAGGGKIARGTLRVGDRLQMLSSDGKRVGVRIDDIKDYSNDQQVQSATAPSEVFIGFTADSKGMAGSENALVTPDSFADLASAQAFFEGAAPKPGLQATDQARAARWGEVTMTLGDRALRMPDPTAMLRESALSSSNLLDFVWQEGSEMRSPTQPSHVTNAVRAITRLDATKPVTLSINAGINDSDGEALILDVLLPLMPRGEWSQLPRTFNFEGKPSPFPGDGLTVYLHDGAQYFDASRARLTLTAFDAAAGRFEGSFSATLLQRPADIVSGNYDAASTIEIRDGRFSVDLSKQ